MPADPKERPAFAIGMLVDANLHEQLITQGYAPVLRWTAIHEASNRTYTTREAKARIETARRRALKKRKAAGDG